MACLSLRVLGELRVLKDDVPIQAFESDKVRALLAYLAVEADHSHGREKLVGLLWPDYPEEAARHNLRQALFNLRVALGDHTAKPPYLHHCSDEPHKSVCQSQLRSNCTRVWNSTGRIAQGAMVARDARVPGG